MVCPRWDTPARHPHIGCAMATFLRREHDAFLFRRRVPGHLQNRIGQRELYRSLGTAVRKIAKRRAAALYVASEHLFAMAEDPTITDEDIHAAARHWLREQEGPAKLRYVDGLMPGELRWRNETLPAELMEGLSEDETWGLTRHMSRRYEAGFALEGAGYPPPYDTSVLDRTVDAMLGLLREYVDKRMDAVFRPEEIMASTAASVSPPVVPRRRESPRIGDPVNVEAWLNWAQTRTPDRKGVSAQTVRQNRVTIRLFVEIVGDRPAGEVSREDAGHFREQLLRLPASHGKGQAVHALKAIASVKAGVALLSMKTTKRHFSAANSYWDWLVSQKHVDVGSSPFSGHSFPGTKSSKSNRDDWSAEDLGVLLMSPDYRAAGSDSALHWLPLIALHSGLRLEEICRLRPRHDIIPVNGIHCFKVQSHPDGWDPKTEAGARDVPVHSWLIDHGLLKLVEQRRDEGQARLFPDLRPTGPDGKLGAEFSREFSRLKTGLQINPKTVFHSFRHSFRTVLGSTDHKTEHIDAIMGHEGTGEGEGRTYNKRYSTSKLRQVVEAFESVLPLEFVAPGEPSLPRVYRKRVKKLVLTPRIHRSR